MCVCVIFFRKCCTAIEHQTESTRLHILRPKMKKGRGFTTLEICQIIIIFHFILRAFSSDSFYFCNTDTLSSDLRSVCGKYVKSSNKFSSFFLLHFTCHSTGTEIRRKNCGGNLCVRQLVTMDFYDQYHDGNEVIDKYQIAWLCKIESIDVHRCTRYNLQFNADEKKMNSNDFFRGTKTSYKYLLDF